MLEFLIASIGISPTCVLGDKNLKIDCRTTKVMEATRNDLTFVDKVPNYLNLSCW
jgi:hypothetical protein